MKGSLVKQGIERILENKDGKVKIKGSEVKGDIVKKRLDIEYKNGRKEKRKEISLMNGEVVEEKKKKKVKKEDKWVEKMKGDIINVRDKMREIMIKEKDESQV